MSENISALKNLAVFADLRKSALFCAMFEGRTGDFLAALLEAGKGDCFGSLAARMVLQSDNPFTRAAASPLGLPIPQTLLDITRSELTLLSALVNAGPPMPVPEAALPLFAKNAAPVFGSATDWGKRLAEFTQYLRKNGSGLFQNTHAFIWDGAALRPAQNPDPVRLENLRLFADKREVVIENTRRLIEGKSANNILLYGDRGSGKSAAVKAVANEFAPQGLRIIEVQKSHLGGLPEIRALINREPLKFIIFIDDLSFESEDDSFVHLKGLLEGGIERCPRNAVVYATSNRRHLVPEKRSTRPGGGGIPAEDDVRAFDTMQSQFSLADRFGITLVFASTSQEEYLAIAEFIAEERGILDSAALNAFRENALRWERWFNGRSPRTARQFVDWLEGGGVFPWGV